MRTTIDPDYRLCQRLGRNVSIRQTEGRCRDCNRCGAPICPLAGAFGRDGFAVMTRRLSAAIGFFG